MKAYPDALSSGNVKRSYGCISTSCEQNLSNCVSWHGGDSSRVTLEDLEWFWEKLHLGLVSQTSKIKGLRTGNSLVIILMPAELKPYKATLKF